MKFFWFKIKRLFQNLINFNKSKKVQLVADADLAKMLSSIGEFEMVIDNKRRCVCCNKIITLNNFGAIFRDNKEYFFICEDYTCLSNFVDNERIS
jgi:hypothetical protein